jgi:hypothetical protein
MAVLAAAAAPNFVCEGDALLRLTTKLSGKGELAWLLRMEKT